jgi:hypothetical protein
MTDFYYGERNYESAYDPIVKLYLHEAQAEARRLKQINQLIDSLEPADASRDLFTFAERKRFNLRGHRK